MIKKWSSSLQAHAHSSSIDFYQNVIWQILYKYVPQELIERPKQGFGVPLGEWLRGPLREWAEDLLSEDGLRREGYFNPAPIRSRWREHLTGAHNWEESLWGVLMFQTWLKSV